MPQYFELYHVIVNLLDTKSVQELPHHISKSHFIHTFTIKNLKSILKKLNKRVHKHVSKESGLFATVWEKIIVCFSSSEISYDLRSPSRTTTVRSSAGPRTATMELSLLLILMRFVRQCLNSSKGSDLA